ncbi:phospholipid-transporting ATPase [Achlya hypogyna]|uniref:Phospholipid-transporting ATPase n=1 Tax=Achlya hypogyna TaxID=1202772 RepID=A0A1V9ZP48_ACHHY|nr:phospholipid-transporting ATPase [Achlya hypogyna]
MGAEPWLTDTVVVNAWRKRSLPLADATFDVGGGPCSEVADRVVTLEVEELQPPTHVLPPRRTLVHLYDEWADKAATFVQRYRVGFSGSGLFQGHVESSSGSSTLSQSTDFACVVVARPELLEEAGLFIYEHSNETTEGNADIVLRYQEPIKAPNSDQVTYQAERFLHFDSEAPAVPQGRKSRRLRESREYMYTPLETLGERSACLYGVVTSYTTPRVADRGRRDYEMTISIIDESRPERAKALYINVFAPTLDALPRILTIGDVIRFHDLLLARYKGYLVGLSTKKTRHVVFRFAPGSHSPPVVEVSHPYADITYLPSDEARALTLLRWGASVLPKDCTQLPRNAHGPPRELRHCFPVETVDVVAFVSSFDVSEAPAPAVAVVTDQEHVTTQLYVHAHARTLQAMGWTKAAVGRWCKLRAVEATAKDHLVFHFRPWSSLEIYPRVLEPAPLAPLLPIQTRVPAAIAALECMCLATFLRQPVPCKAHVMAEIAAISPERASEFTTRHGLDYVYMGIFRLQDPTGSVDAILYGADGATFFKGLSPTAMAEGSPVAASLASRLNLLRAHRQPLQWCLGSYTTKHGDVRSWLRLAPHALNGRGMATPYREIVLNAAPTVPFCDNFVVSSKYTLVSFVPKFLFETFRKLANAYFLVVSLMQLVPSISNTGGKPSTAPTLLFIMLVDAVFAILEDHKRHVADNIANARLTLVLQGGAFVTKKWRDVLVGDFVKLTNHDQVPADLLVLAVAEQPGIPPSGICYVETKSLDGETNMKVRQAMELTTATCHDPATLVGLRGHVHCEHPNAGINSFQGVLTIGDTQEAIPYKSVLLRGCTLRNTEWIVGLVLNTGKDTKIMRNNTATPSKMSSMDLAINRYIIVLVGVLFTCCAVGATGSVLWDATYFDAWYFAGASPDAAVDWWTMFFYFFLLMYQFVPISLYVSMSMVKYIQAVFIQWDIGMYFADTDTPALVRTMSLNEELGQVSYIFSDKTGTLTCNMMEFRKCSVGGTAYGRGTTEIGLAALRRAGKPLPPDDSATDTKPRVPYVNYDGPEIFEHMAAADAQARRLHHFFLHLAVCHTVIPERREGSDEVTLSASSPDEQALVSGAGFFGYEFTNRNPGRAYLRVRGATVEYELLDVLEFNSARKRMSTVVRDPSGALLLFTKGADVVIYARLKDPTGSIQTETSSHINVFAEEGLRTLTIAMKTLDEAYYKSWRTRYHAALNDLNEIDKRKKEAPNAIDTCMEELETDLELLGATAIEDKLQPGVPDTIATLAEAGLKIWVLTGDKEETAINIGFACNLLHNGMKRVVINAELCPTPANIETELRRQQEVRGSDDVALVIDGESLIHALRGSCRLALLAFARNCKAVIACRVSPAQKAEMVNLIKSHVPGVKTLAIGDGANDVPMIQEAHIGVGISGQEGLQAVNASDYAIGRFRFLKRLLLVHGRWSYLRMAQLVLYMFYKNIMLTAAEFWYTCLTGFSGQKFYLETGFQVYNVVFTSCPIVLLAILDQDVSDTMALAFPKLYGLGPENACLNARVFTVWIAAALVESVGIALLTVYGFERSALFGDSPPMWLIGNVVFTIVVVLANAKLTLFQNAWLWVHYIVYAGSVGLWVATAYVASSWEDISGWYWAGMMPTMLGLPVTWLILGLVPIALLLPTYTVLAATTEWRPEYNQLAKEVAKFGLDTKLLQWAGLPIPATTSLFSKSATTSSKHAGTVVPVTDKKRLSITEMLSRTVHNGFAFSSDDNASREEARRTLKSHGSDVVSILKEVNQ